MDRVTDFIQSNRPSYLKDSRRKCWFGITTSPWPPFHRQVSALIEEKGSLQMGLLGAPFPADLPANPVYKSESAVEDHLKREEKIFTFPPGFEPQTTR